MPRSCCAIAVCVPHFCKFQLPCSSFCAAPGDLFASIAQSCRERNHLPLDLERTPSFIMCMLVILSLPLYSFLCERTRSIFMSDMKKQILIFLTTPERTRRALPSFRALLYSTAPVLSRDETFFVHCEKCFGSHALRLDLHRSAAQVFVNAVGD